MADCMFCKIAGGKIPSNTVYNDDNFRVILDISPANEGHCLVIPKAHAENIFELDENLVGEAHKLAKKIVHALKESLGVKDFNIIQNNGSYAGQTVDHFHIHIIPRNSRDSVVIKTGTVNISPEQLIRTLRKIKQALED